MGSTNYGNQTITFNYQQEATASGFNGLLYKIIPTGIIEGGECSIDTNNNTITVSPMNVILNGVDALGNDSELVIHVTTENSITSLSPDNATPYVVARFNWEEADNNYMDVICVQMVIIMRVKQKNVFQIKRIVKNKSKRIVFNVHQR